MSEKLDRRKFGIRLVAGASLPATGALTAEGAEPVPAAPAANRSLDAVSSTELIVELVRRKYADPHLDDSALGEIRNDVAMQQRRSLILSSFPLVNSDAPAFLFQALRTDSPAVREP